MGINFKFVFHIDFRYKLLNYFIIFVFFLLNFYYFCYILIVILSFSKYYDYLNILFDMHNIYKISLNSF